MELLYGFFVDVGQNYLTRCEDEYISFRRTLDWVIVSSRMVICRRDTDVTARLTT